jgi:hypothetical protein
LVRRAANHHRLARQTWIEQLLDRGKKASRSTWATTRVAGSTAGGWFTLAIIRNVSFRKACLPTGDRAMGLCYRIPRRNVRVILGID